MDYVLAPVYLVMVPVLVMGWPLLAVGAGVLPASGLLVVLRERTRTRALDTPKRRRRAAWLLTAGTMLTAIAAYGYGLSRTAGFGISHDPNDDLCRWKLPDGIYHEQGATEGSATLFPLHDTTCGPELVPGFVNPLLVGSAVVFAALVVIMVWTKIIASRRLNQPISA
ncbi:hypothetical protein [Krasilnikovia sp. MM14-A1259]|uniref:hypothetical protein n=1 Tax=Krasilnikovia sp. MM14-A1259 TaxID=3373539 RepID=UPI00399C82CA